MSEDCEFCKLVKKEGHVSCIYEDARVMAFLNIKPTNEGHALVIPKMHYETIYDVPDEEVAYLFKIVKKVACAVKKGVDAEGISITQHNGRATGQYIFHVHVHVIPRYEGDKLTVDARHTIQDIHETSRERLDATARKIKAYI